MTDDLLTGIRKCISQDQHRFFDSRTAKQERLLHRCHCKSPQILIFFSHMCDRDCSMTIPVSFDYCYDLRLFCKMLFHVFKIICSCIQVNLCAYSDIRFHTCSSCLSLMASGRYSTRCRAIMP